MADLLDPFMTFYRVSPDHDSGDARREAIALFERQEMIEDYLRGRVPEEAVLDTLHAQGIDPDDYADQVARNVDYVIDAGIRFETNDSGIYVPSPL